jgi:hypothetical protein
MIDMNRIVRDPNAEVTEIDKEVDILNKAIIIKIHSEESYVNRDLVKSVDEAISIIKGALDKECKRNINNKN